MLVILEIELSNKTDILFNVSTWLKFNYDWSLALFITPNNKIVLKLSLLYINFTNTAFKKLETTWFGFP